VLAREGARVGLSNIDDDGMIELADEVGSAALALPPDVGDATRTQNALAAAVGAWAGSTSSSAQRGLADRRTRAGRVAPEGSTCVVNRALQREPATARPSWQG
jgi:hypothetical protein